MRTEALTRFDFNGLPIQAIEHEGDLWMLSEDIGRGLGYADPRKGINNIFDRNKTELEGYSCVIKMGVEGLGNGGLRPQIDVADGGSDIAEGASNPTQRRPVRVFNEEGVMILTMLSNQPRAAEFRAWAVKILKAYRHGELALTAGPQREAVLITCIKEARFGNPVAIETLIRRYGYPESIRRDIKSDLLRRASRAPAIAPELADWFIETLLPRLRAEIQAGSGPLLTAIDNPPPRARNWRLRQVPGALWTLEHRAPDLFHFATCFAVEEEVDVDITPHLFTRWLGYKARRIEQIGWLRTEHHAVHGDPIYHLSLMKSPP